MNKSLLLILLAIVIMLTKRFQYYFDWSAVKQKMATCSAKARAWFNLILCNYNFWPVLRVIVMFLMITAYLFDFVDRFDTLGGWWSTAVRLFLGVLMLMAWYLMTRGGS